MVAGLVAVTPAAGAVDIVGAVLIGLFANVTRGAGGAVTSHTWAPDGALNGLVYGGGFTQLATHTVVAVSAVVISGVMTVRAARTGKIGDGKVWSTPVETLLFHPGHPDLDEWSGCAPASAVGSPVGSCRPRRLDRRACSGGLL